jgi:hypothetical protein
MVRNFEMANEHRPHRPNLYSRDWNDQSNRNVVSNLNKNTSPNLPRFSVDSSMIPPMLSSMLSGSSLSGLGVSGDSDVSDSNRLTSRLAPPLIPLPLVLLLAACGGGGGGGGGSSTPSTSGTPKTPTTPGTTTST